MRLEKPTISHVRNRGQDESDIGQLADSGQGESEIPTDTEPTDTEPTDTALSSIPIMVIAYESLQERGKHRHLSCEAFP
jgi:hypothetical protein